MVEPLAQALLHSLAQAQLVLILRSALAQALGYPSPLAGTRFQRFLNKMIVFLDWQPCLLQAPFPPTVPFVPGQVSLLREVACLGFWAFFLWTLLCSFPFPCLSQAPYFWSLLALSRPFAFALFRLSSSSCCCCCCCFPGKGHQIGHFFLDSCQAPEEGDAQAFPHQLPPCCSSGLGFLPFQVPRTGPE